MIIEEQNVITLTYELRENNEHGDLLERVESDSPFTFLFGLGHLLPSFEEKLRGLKEGERFSFILTPEESYGESNPANIVEIPRGNFRMEDGGSSDFLTVGTYVTLMDNAGREHIGRIHSVTNDFVKVDLNHAMAGKTLHFQGTILHIRKASPEEMSHQHHHPQEGEAGFMDEEE